MNEENDHGLGIKTVLEIDGHKYPVTYLPGEGLLFKPADLTKLFPVITLDHVKVPFTVLNALAGRVLGLIEENEGVVELVREDDSSPSPAEPEEKQVKEMPKKPAKKLDLNTFKLNVENAQPAKVDKGKEPPSKVSKVWVAHSSQTAEADCPHCSGRKKKLQRAYVGDFSSEWKCEGCGKKFHIGDLHARECKEAYSPAYQGPDPDKLSCYYSEEGFKLSAEQHDAIRRVLKSTKPLIVVTGLAGSGKSVLIRVLQSYYDMTVTATTGKASLNVDGITIDSLTSMNRDTWRVRSAGVQKWAMEKTSRKIIVDECSMIGKKMADFLLNVSSQYQRQWVWFGDYGQAQPVKDGLVLDSRAVHDYEFIKLVECHRQSQGPYLEALNKVRVGVVDQQVTAVFEQCVQPQAPDDDTFIRMFATNSAADGYNQLRLRQLTESGEVQSWPLNASFSDVRPANKREQYPRDNRFAWRKIEDSNLANGSRFAVGCQVVFTVNDSGESRRFVNGDTGTIVGAWCGRQRVEDLSFDPFSGHAPDVTEVEIRLHRTGEKLRLPPMKREVKDAGDRPDCVITGFPFKLGYALTIHKAQGMTVDHAWVDMSTIMAHPKESRCGLAYVALSRTRTLDGLKISQWVPDAVACNEQLLPLM